MASTPIHLNETVLELRKMTISLALQPLQRKPSQQNSHIIAMGAVPLNHVHSVDGVGMKQPRCQHPAIRW